MENEICKDNRVTVMAKTGFMPEIKKGYGNDIFGILVSIFLIIGGLSGRLVLRGTDSSPALVIAGFIFLAWDIITLVKKRKQIEKDEEDRFALSSKMNQQEKTVQKDMRQLSAPVRIRIVSEKSLAILDFGAKLNGTSMSRDAKERTSTAETSRVRNIINFYNIDLTVAFDVTGTDMTEAVFELFRDKNGIGITLPEGVTLIPEEKLPTGLTREY